MVISQMADIIHLLPDSIANQIAAGEVVQRPASVVKELLENSIDAGCKAIQLIVKDGGKTSIQVVDDGIGMSETDARLCFERHATSKIKEAADLYSIRTMGFRGEALASIAAVAEVELRTRRLSDEVGSMVQVGGSEIVAQQPVSCPVGSTLTVKNLFYNVPARRKFLKSNSVELKHIISEFQHVALAFPEISMSLSHNGSEIYKLAPSNLKQRIVNLFGKSISSQLVDCVAETSIVTISGYIGKPESARKSPGEQFFFVNGRFMKSPFLHKAVVNAYNRLLPANSIPTYFIYFRVDPGSIDVNIHPTKTEVKFEDDGAVWQIVHAAVREALGKFAVAPSIDFSSDPGFSIPHFPKDSPVELPEIELNPNFNPFEDEGARFAQRTREHNFTPQQPVKGWEQLYQDVNPNFNFEPKQTAVQTFASKGFDDSVAENTGRFFQIKGKYIITAVKSGMLVVDQKRAHERILYEQFYKNLNLEKNVAQRELYPQTIELNPQDFETIITNQENFLRLGLDISNLNHNTISINSLPGNTRITDPALFLENLLAIINENEALPFDSAKEKIALSMAKAAAVGYGKRLSESEMQEVVDQLFACREPNYTADGKKTIALIEMSEFEKWLK